MSSRLLTISCLLSSLLLGAGCSSVDTAETPSPQDEDGEKKELAAEGTSTSGGQAASNFCAEFCEREVACDPATDADTCTAKCKNENDAFLSKLRADYTGHLTKCIDGSACKDLDSGAAVSSCVDEARAQVSVTATATDFCSDYSAAATKCGEKLDKARCLDLAKIYSDATLAEATKCLSKKCADIDACVSAATGATETEPAPPPAETCSAELPYSASCTSCMTSSCCAEDNACANSTSCISYINCVQSCTTASCATSCGTSYPTGRSLAQSLVTCMDNSCPASCAD